MRPARRRLWVKDLIAVPDLHLRRATQIDAAVGFRYGFVFDQQLDIAKLLVGRCIGTVTVVDELAVLDRPILREIGPLLRKVCVFLLTRQPGNAVRVQAMPAGKVSAVENRPEALRRARFCGAANTRNKQPDEADGEKQAAFASTAHGFAPSIIDTCRESTTSRGMTNEYSSKRFAASCSRRSTSGATGTYSS